MPILCWSLRGPITTRAVCAAPISLSVELTAYGKPQPLGRYFDESDQAEPVPWTASLAVEGFGRIGLPKLRESCSTRLLPPERVPGGGR